MSHLRAIPGGDAALPRRSGSATQVRVEAPLRVTLTHAATRDDARAPGALPVLAGVVQAVRLIETVTARRQSLDAHGLVHPGEGWTDVVVTPAKPVRSGIPARNGASAAFHVRGITREWL